jgi:hypothetical protein
MCGALVLAGCGGGGAPAGADTAEAQFVALGNAICRELKAHPGAHARPARPASTREETRLSRLRALMTSDTKLPHVGMFRSDLAAQKRVQFAMLRSVSPTKDGIAANATELYEQFYRANVKVWADEKALGLNACMGPHPRKPIGG